MAQPRYHGYFQLSDGTRVMLTVKGPSGGSKQWPYLRAAGRRIASDLMHGRGSAGELEPEFESFERGGE